MNPEDFLYQGEAGDLCSVSLPVFLLSLSNVLTLYSLSSVRPNITLSRARSGPLAPLSPQSEPKTLIPFPSHHVYVCQQFSSFRLQCPLTPSFTLLLMRAFNQAVEHEKHGLDFFLSSI